MLKNLIFSLKQEEKRKKIELKIDQLNLLSNMENNREFEQLILFQQNFSINKNKVNRFYFILNFI